MRGNFAERSDEDEPSDASDGEDDEDDDREERDDTDEEEPSAPGGEILAAADPDAVDGLRDLLAAMIAHLDGEEEDLLRVAQRADVETLNPDEMSPDELARLTYEMADGYPDVLEAVTNRFPRAEPLLIAVLGGESASREEAGE